MNDRGIKNTLYGEYVVMQKGDNYDFPIAIFLVEDDAVEYSHCTFGDRYVVEVCKIIELQELMEEE